MAVCRRSLRRVFFLYEVHRPLLRCRSSALSCLSLTVALPCCQSAVIIPVPFALLRVRRLLPFGVSRSPDSHGDGRSQPLRISALRDSRSCSIRSAAGPGTLHLSYRQPNSFPAAFQDGHPISRWCRPAYPFLGLALLARWRVPFPRDKPVHRSTPSCVCRPLAPTPLDLRIERDSPGAASFSKAFFSPFRFDRPRHEHFRWLPSFAGLSQICRRSHTHTELCTGRSAALDRGCRDHPLLLREKI